MKAAVILCGSGFKDGSEIRESVGVLWALSQEGVSAACFALDEPQADVVNCLSGQPMPGEKRNQLTEAARIARGQVQPLQRLNAFEYDFLVLPGGFGAAKNLCDFAMKGSGGKVHPEVKKTLEAFRAAGKPIGAVCIAPAILALAFHGSLKLELTVGGRSEAAEELEKLGHKHVEKQANEWHVDRANKIVTTPAYMYDSAPLHEIFAGIHGLVRELKQLR
jgi:enhancing lycopene biosynthesis protein 2